MATNVEDLAAVTSVMFSEAVYTQDKKIPPVLWNPAAYADTGKKRIGFVVAESSVIPLPDCQVRAVRLAKERLEALGHELVEIKAPSLYDILITHTDHSFAYRKTNTKVREPLVNTLKFLIKIHLVPQFLKGAITKFADMLGKRHCMYNMLLKATAQKKTAYHYQKNY
jgi:Asp-tRNA(Asn)/Glu-tRNA(Gln) amidotransferase A subunit family amidase